LSSLKARNQLEHLLLGKINEQALGGKKILLALSGGLDSVALFHLLKRVHGNFEVAHFHHGDSSNQTYRDEALEFCKNLAQKSQIPFHSMKSSKTAASEAEYRQQRYEFLMKLLNDKQFAAVAMAHHRDDLLETRLLRLIRGTGAQGLESMGEFKNQQFRPLLEVSKDELLAYLSNEGLESYLEDPTNQELDPLRNWVRQEWLPGLEGRQKGAVNALARSLATLASELSEKEAVGDLLRENEANKSHLVESQALSRAFFASLGPQNQKRLLAQYLLSLGKRDFSQSHLEEICKRLDNSQRVITFKVAACFWEINAEQIKVQV
jgi:tRNA(Ile)-lysidine synthase